MLSTFDAQLKLRIRERDTLQQQCGEKDAEGCTKKDLCQKQKQLWQETRSEQKFLLKRTQDAQIDEFKLKQRVSELTSELQQLEADEERTEESDKSETNNDDYFLQVLGRLDKYDEFLSGKN